MTTPSPFEIGGAIGENVGKAFQGFQDRSAIDEILEQAMASGDTNAPNNAMRMILQRVSPERQPAAIQILQQTQQQLAGRRNQQEHVKIADQIESSNPNSSMHRMIAQIYRSELPIEQKEKLVKSVSGSVPFKAEQQQRLQLDSVLKRYNSRIKEIEASIKEARYDDRKILEGQKKALQDERDQLLNFQALSQKPKKMKFDPANQEHRAKAEEIFKITKDKNAVREKLSEEFEF